MRRLISIAAFALLLTVPVWAQRGGHGGGGGHAGFSGGHGGGFGGHAGGFGGHGGGFGRGGGSFGGGHFGGSRGFSGYRGGMGFSHRNPGFSNNFSHRPFLHDGFRGRGFGNHGFRHHRFQTYGFRNNCYGWRCGWRSGWGWGNGYPWWGSAYYDPWWWWNQDDQQFDQDYYNQYQIANEMNQQSLEQQRMWHEEEQAGDQDAYAPQRPESAAADPPQRPEPEGQPIISPTVLVFRDQHREEVHNYAIVGNTLWNFAPAKTQKIALAQLDLPATEKVNEDRGVTFSVPGAN